MARKAEADLELDFKRTDDEFPTAEDRHVAALKLATLDPTLLPEAEHLGRDFVVAHWGDYQEQRRAISDYLHNLKSDLRGRDGEPVIVMRSGSLSDINYDDNDILLGEVELDFGRIEEGKVNYGYGRRLSTGRPGERPTLTHLTVSLGVAVSSCVRIEGDDTGIWVDDDLAAQPAIEVYHATLPLDFDADT